MSEILLPMFSPRIFMVLGLTFKSLIHFEFILVCGVRRQSCFIFLHVSAQSSQHHILNKLSLAHCMCLFPLLTDYKGMGLFLGSLFCSINLSVHFYATTRLFWLLWPYSILYFHIRLHDSSNFVLFQDCCCFAGPFVIPYTFLKYLF